MNLRFGTHVLMNAIDLHNLDVMYDLFTAYGLRLCHSHLCCHLRVHGPPPIEITKKNLKISKKSIKI